MKLFQITIEILLVLGISQGALAAKKAKKTAPSIEEKQIFSMPVSQSAIQIEAQTLPSRKRKSLEVGFSTWSPKFALSSYLSNTGEFGRANLPLLNINLISHSIEPGAHGQLSPTIGFAFINLDRKASFDSASTVPQIAHESLNLFSLRLGAEYMFSVGSQFKPLLGLYLLPTWMVAARTELDNGLSAYGLPVEASFDLLYDSQKLSKLVGDADLLLGLGIHDIYGSVSGADLNGLGVQGIFRLRM